MSQVIELSRIDYDGLNHKMLNGQDIIWCVVKHPGQNVAYSGKVLSTGVPYYYEFYGYNGCNDRLSFPITEEHVIYEFVPQPILP
jgi:hypothetical protein